jgi:hypothetical protein
VIGIHTSNGARLADAEGAIAGHLEEAIVASRPVLAAAREVAPEQGEQVPSGRPHRNELSFGCPQRVNGVEREPHVTQR